MYLPDHVSQSLETHLVLIPSVDVFTHTFSSAAAIARFRYCALFQPDVFRRIEPHHRLAEAYQIKSFRHSSSVKGLFRVRFFCCFRYRSVLFQICFVKYRFRLPAVQIIGQPQRGFRRNTLRTLLGECRGVRREDDVPKREQRVVRGRRLLFENVQRRACDPVFRERFCQRGFVDDSAPARC